MFPTEAIISIGHWHCNGIRTSNLFWHAIVLWGSLVGAEGTLTMSGFVGRW